MPLLWPALLGVAVLVAAFWVCDWSGRTLARHYQDRWEVAAVLAVGACLLGAALVGGGDDDAVSWPGAALAFFMAAGLFTGYFRSGGTR